MKNKKGVIKKLISCTPAFNSKYLKYQGFSFRAIQGLMTKGLLTKYDYNVYGDPELKKIRPFERTVIIASSLFPLNPICLSTALYFHNLIDDQPDFVEVAIKKGKTIPRFQMLPFKFRSFSEQYFKLGQSNTHLNNRLVKTYDAEKTIIDCFRFRKELGEDYVKSAMKRYMAIPNKNINQLQSYRDRIDLDKAVFNEWLFAAMVS